MINGYIFNSTTMRSEPTTLTIPEAIADMCAWLQCCMDTEDKTSVLQILYDLVCACEPDPRDYPILRMIAARWKARDQAVEDFFAPYWAQLREAEDVRPPLRVVHTKRREDSRG